MWCAGIVDNVYDVSVSEVQKRQDEASDRAEAEADNKTVETIEGKRGTQAGRQAEEQARIDEREAPGAKEVGA